MFFFGIDQDTLARLRTDFTNMGDGGDLESQFVASAASSCRVASFDRERLGETGSSTLKRLRISSSNFVIWGLMVAFVIL